MQRQFAAQRFPFLSWLLFCLLASSIACGAAPKNPSLRWEKDIQRFEASDRTHPPPHGAILFAGSSSIRIWHSLHQDFPEYKIIQRGFGGSEMSDLVYYAERIILPYHPRLVVVYEGDNDIAAGKTPKQVLTDFQQLVRLIHSSLPKTRVAFIAIKPCPARWKFIDKVREANRLIHDYVKTRSYLDYIDIYHPMFEGHSKPPASLFLPDGLHLNKKGYALWVKVIRPHLR